MFFKRTTKPELIHKIISNREIKISQINMIVNVFFFSSLSNDKPKNKMSFYTHLKRLVIKLGYMQDYSNGGTQFFVLPTSFLCGYLFKCWILLLASVRLNARQAPKYHFEKCQIEFQLNRIFVDISRWNTRFLIDCTSIYLCLKCTEDEFK